MKRLEEGWQVRYVRSAKRFREWRSVTTGRTFEVGELESYARSEALEVGAKGYLAFRGAVLTVRRFPPIKGRE